MPKNTDLNPKTSFLTFSDETHVPYMGNVIATVERFFTSKGYEVRTANRSIPSGEELLREITTHIRNSCIGVVVLDGLRLNVAFEYGMFSAFDRPVILLKEKKIKLNIDRDFSDIKSIKYRKYNQFDLKELEEDILDDELKLWESKINKIITERIIAQTVFPQEITPQIIKDLIVTLEKVIEIMTKINVSFSFPSLSQVVKAEKEVQLSEIDSEEFKKSSKTVEDIVEKHKVKLPSTYYDAQTNKEIGDRYRSIIKNYDEEMGLTDSDRQQAEKYFQRGLELERKGALAFASRCFEKAAKIDPLRYGEHGGFPYPYYKDKRVEKAMELIRLLSGFPKKRDGD